MLRMLKQKTDKMERDLGSLLSDIKKELTAYISLKLEILKLDIYEKSSVFSSVLLYGLVLLLIVFFAVLFLFLALGFYIGNLLNNFAIGMASVAGLYIIALCILLWKRKKIQNWMTNIFVEQIVPEEDVENEKE